MIGTPRHRDLLRQALSLLARERQLLLAGDFDSMPALSRAMEGTATALERLGEPTDPALVELLESVRAAAARNGALAEASRRGLKAAGRLAADPRETAELGTYTGLGRRRTISATVSTRDRRA